MNINRMISQVLLALALIAMFLTACDVIGVKTTEEPAPPETQVVSRDARVIVEGRIVPQEDSELYFLSGGEVAEVLVSVGERVSQGQVLARLGDRERYQAMIATAELELTLAQQAMEDLVRTTPIAYQQARLAVALAEAADTSARSRLAEIDTDETQQDIDDANVKLSDAKDVLDDAQEEFDKVANLDPDNTERKNAEDELEEAQNTYDEAERERDQLVITLEQARIEVELSKAQLEEAMYALDQRTDGPDKTQMAALEARLGNAQAQLIAAEAALSNLDLIAPYDGTIVKISILAGETALPSRAVMVIADFSSWYVETTDLTENEVVLIEVGQAALIVPDALPELEMNAEVESIGESYQLVAGDITYTARLLLSDPDPQIRWGMTVEVTFEEK